MRVCGSLDRMASKTRTNEGERTTELLAKESPQPLVTVLWPGGNVARAVPTDRPCTLGRGGDADIVIDERSISRRHATLHFRAEGLVVEDHGSSNGTRVRGRRLEGQERVSLGWGEPFEVGESVVIVRAPRSMTVLEKADAPLGRVSDIRMGEVERLVELVAPTDISVLVLGETGVGKGYFSRKIHDRSKRQSMPWLHLNCAALPEPLLESELFGYERGAFTGAQTSKPGLFESASGGTIFLDEVGELPAALQAKILTTLERREVMRLGGLKPRPFDVRFISATSRDLEGADRAAMSAALFFRLAGVSITVPPLRERPLELRALTSQFVAESAARLGRPVPAISPAAERALAAYDFPGNIRELAALLERALLFSGATLEAEHLSLRRRGASHAPAAAPTAAPSQRTLAEEVDATERASIIEALEACVGNQSRAAELLGISRRKLISRMISFGLPRPRKG